MLTAASCVTSNNTLVTLPVGNLSVRAGSLQHASGGVVSQITRVIVHEDYAGEESNDLAMLKLAEPLLYSPSIAPIAITNVDITANTTLTISGWVFGEPSTGSSAAAAASVGGSAAFAPPRTKRQVPPTHSKGDCGGSCLITLPSASFLAQGFQ
ncbi:maker300 [Drosophila busckii]|uniref:trypsin n=1 Tax=Drosophila busckii TaxID=30019 RepID=A0A0M4ETF1_DROBS|nr:maker300 [Drosophila busckii]